MATLTDTDVTRTETLRTQAADRIAAIRGNAAISDEARLANIARAYLAAKDELDQMQQRTTASRDADLRRLRTAAFGIDDLAPTPADRAALAISARDAQDRVADTTPGEARLLLQRATDSGDTVLARAIAQRAFDSVRDPLASSQWSDILDAYATTYPDTITTLNDLGEAQRSTHTTATLFAFVITPPTELANIPEYRIRALAAGDMPQA